MTTTTLSASVRNIFVNDQVKPALCVPSAQDVACVISETDGIRVVTITLDEFVKAEPVHTSNGADYPLSRFADTCVRQSRKEGALQRPFTRAAAKLVAPYVSADLEFKPAAAPSRKASSASSNATPRGNLVATVCAELGLEPKKARRILRAAGLNAPYTDEAAIRAALASKPAAKKTPAAAPASDAPAAKKTSRKTPAAPSPTVAADGQPLDPSLSVKARRAASRAPSKAVKVPVESQPSA